MSLVRVRMNLRHGGFGEVYVDDVPLQGVKSIGFESRVGEPTIVALELIAESVDVETEAVLAPHIESVFKVRQSAESDNEIATHDGFRR